MTGLFIAPDGHNDMTLWQESPGRPDYPEALVRECDVKPEVWLLILDAVGLRSDLERVIAEHEGNRTAPYAGTSNYVPISVLREVLDGEAS